MSKGLFAHSLKEWLKHFPKEQLKVSLGKAKAMRRTQEALGATIALHQKYYLNKYL